MKAMFHRRSYKLVYLKSVAVFVVVIFVLLLKPAFYTVPLENRHPNYRLSRTFPITTTVNITPKVITIFQTVNFKDKYCVLYYFWDFDADYAAMKNAVTLVLHASPTHLKHLEAQIRSWTGPISVAVFVPTPEDTQIRKSSIRVKAIFSAIRKLEKRLLDIQNDKSQVALHLFFEKHTSECPTLNISRNFDLEFPVELDEMEDFTLPVKLYPINVGRNIAREGVMSDLFISGDAEQVYSDGFEKVMSMIGAELITKQKRKVALVHRRFEVADDVQLPRNKAELKKLLANESAVPFHKFIYPLGHYIPYLDDWLVSPDDIFNTVTVPYNNTLWEPQFVAANNVETPFHDERFPYRFKTNTHLAVLLCYHNFTFAVVDNIFSVHRGIKYNQTLENEFLYAYGKRNGLHQIFNTFNNELNETYPASKVDQCGILWFDWPQNVTLKANCTV